jgi:hypothetical protein
MTKKYTGWLTDDNIQFILRHRNFWSGVSQVDINDDLNIVLGTEILLRTNTSATYLTYCYSKIPIGSRNETQINVLKRFKDNWKTESKDQTYTIFPLTLGGHPGNHWGVLIIEKGSGYNAFWVDSIGGYENQVKSLVAYLTNETTANRITPLTPVSRQSDGYNCGVYACFYIKEIVSRLSLELKQVIRLENLKTFRDKWSAEIGEDKWCKVGGATEDDFGGWDWESIGIFGSQVDEWFYGTDKPIGQKGLFFEHALDLILAGFLPEEGTFANWAYQEFRKQKAQEMSVETTDELLDEITPHILAQSLYAGYENLENLRKQFEEQQLEENIHSDDEDSETEERRRQSEERQRRQREEAEKKRREAELAKENNWQNHGNPFLGFTPKLTQAWKNKGFSKDNCQEWLNIGLKAKDYDFAKYLSDNLECTPEEIFNCDASLSDLREQYTEYFNPSTPQPTKKPTKSKPEKPHECRICKKYTFYSRAEFIQAHGIPKPEPSVWVWKKVIICKKPIINKYMWICRVCKQEYHTVKCKYYSPPQPIIPIPEPFDWESYWKWWFGVLTLDWESSRFFGKY